MYRKIIVVASAQRRCLMLYFGNLVVGLQAQVEEGLPEGS